MTSTVNELREQFKIDDQLHKRVYLFTYAFARPEGQRALRTPPLKHTLPPAPLLSLCGCSVLTDSIGIGD